MRMFSERILGETPELQATRACGCASSAAATASRAALLEQMDWAEAETADNDAHHAVRRLRLRRAGGDPRRGRSASTAAARRTFRALLYAPEMHDPDLVIRTSGEQRTSNYLLWQSRLLRAGLPRRAVAGLHARGVRGRAGRVRGAPAPLRGALSDAQPRRGRPRRSAGRGAPARRAATRRSDLGDRMLVAIPAIAFALSIVALGRDRVHRRARACSASSACTSSTRCSTARSPARLAGFVGPHRHAAGGLTAATSTTSCWRWRCRPADLPGRGQPGRGGGARVDRGDAARACRGSGWRSPTRCCCASSTTATGIIIDVLRRHLRRRHGRLPRRPGVRRAASSRRRSRPTRRSRAWRSASSLARRWPSGSRASTRTGCRAPTR